MSQNRETGAEANRFGRECGAMIISLLGAVAVNVRNAYEAANHLADLGFAPFVPHATHFWHMLFPRPYEFWLELDNQFLTCCAAVLRLPGESSGADKEVQLAQPLGIPVFTEFDDLAKYFAGSANPRRADL